MTTIDYKNSLDYYTYNDTLQAVGILVMTMKPNAAVDVTAKAMLQLTPVSQDGEQFYKADDVQETIISFLHTC